ncbi:MAG: 5-(carboxyamino)imidazole ribonucleotide mutase [Saprospiraceae bacterium]
MAKVSIVMGSDSDMKVMKGSVDILSEFGIDYEIAVISAHRTPELLDSYIKTLENKGYSCVIAGAGGAAALPGVIAALTSLPVIGVPVKSTISIDGWDSILSILQMPSGIPVATVALDNSKNAALLAVRIIALFEDSIAEKLKEFNANLKLKVVESNKRVKEQGFNVADLDIL